MLICVNGRALCDSVLCLFSKGSKKKRQLILKTQQIIKLIISSFGHMVETESNFGNGVLQEILPFCGIIKLL